MYTENTRVCKTPFPASTAVEQIEEYTDKVVKGLVVCILPPCSGCNLKCAWFKRHEARRRIFYVVVDQIVHTVFGLLVRWKCPACGKTFTQYPDFALPYKRYTLPTILDFSSRYTESPTMTYRKTVRSAQLGYKGSERQLEHSTVHRWLTGLGGLTKTVAYAADTLLQIAPSSSACLYAARLPVEPAKYRSDERKSLLQRCRRFFFFEAVARKLLFFSIFPKLATDCRYG